jgi:hypothetical protein
MTLSETYISLKQTLANNLATKGVTGYSSNDGMTTLINGVLNIQTGSGGGVTNIVQGTFTTGSTRNSVETVSIPYTGSGYPIAVTIYVAGGAYNNNSSTGNLTWYNSTNRYDVGAYYMTKARTTSEPTYKTSGTDNYGVVAIIYKNSTSQATTYTRTSSMTVNTFSSNNAQASTACVRFKNNNKTMTYYIGNSGSSYIGFAPSIEYSYIIIYSS